MSLEGVKEMDLGAILDYCIEWNDIHIVQEDDGIRDATQEDIERYFG